MGDWGSEGTHITQFQGFWVRPRGFGGARGQNLFSLKCNLKRHISSEHECKTCEAKFSREDDLKEHITSVQGKEKPHKFAACKMFYQGYII